MLDVVLRARRGVPKYVDLHRVVDHQIDRHQRVDLLRVAAQRASSRRASRPGRRRTGTPVKSCSITRAGLERHLDVLRARRAFQAAEALARRPRVDQLAVDVAQHGLQQHLDRERQAREARARRRPSRARPAGRWTAGPKPVSSGARAPKTSVFMAILAWRLARAGREALERPTASLYQPRDRPRRRGSRSKKRSGARPRRRMPDARARPRRARGGGARARASTAAPRSNRWRPDSRVSMLERAAQPARARAGRRAEAARAEAAPPRGSARSRARPRASTARFRQWCMP